MIETMLPNADTQCRMPICQKMIGNPFVMQFSHVNMYSLHKYVYTPSQAPA